MEDEIPELPLPPMRMDVLGLRHGEMMNKVRSSGDTLNFMCGHAVQSNVHGALRIVNFTYLG
jgi:hypothetical protein